MWPLRFKPLNLVSSVTVVALLPPLRGRTIVVMVMVVVVLPWGPTTPSTAILHLLYVS